MKKEIERKFLVSGDEWRAAAGKGLVCKQGYLSSGGGITVRVRRLGEKGFLTLKGPTSGISRSEMEYDIPVDDADFMLDNFCGDRVVCKTRYRIGEGELVWEVDEFSGRNNGLVLAEIELQREDQPFKKPVWLGEEVSFDARYFNASLAENPYFLWDI